MIRSRLFAAFIIGQAIALFLAGLAMLWWSQDLMTWLIHRVGEERALGSANVIHLPSGGLLLTNPESMVRWTVPILTLGLIQLTASLSLFGLWVRSKNQPAGGWVETKLPSANPEMHAFVVSVSRVNTTLLIDRRGE